MTKVFGIGLSRTGTTSLTAALQRLGYETCHFPCDAVTQMEIYRFWESGSPYLQLSILNAYDAITDTPVCYTYQALDRAYPGSKFILTVRDKISWLSSCQVYWQYVITPYFNAHPNAAYTRFARFINAQVYGTEEFDPEVFSQTYDTYYLQVEQYFRDRKECLLVLNICGGEGWEKLCEFLQKPVLEDRFPTKNQFAALIS